MNSNCSNLREQLGPWIDGGLGEADAQQVRDHLDACPPCRREEQLLRATVSAIASVEPVGVPPTFREEIQGRLRTEAILVRTRQTYRRAIAMAASVALVCGLGLGLGLGGMYGGVDAPETPIADAGDQGTPFRGVPSGPNRTVNPGQSAAVTNGQRPVRPGTNVHRGGSAATPVYLGRTESSAIPRDYYLDSTQLPKENTEEELPAVVRVSF